MVSKGGNIIFFLVLYVFNLANAQDLSQQELQKYNSYRQSLLDAQKGNDQVKESQFLNRIAFYFWEIGEYDSAVYYFKDLLQLHTKTGNPQGEIKTNYNIGFLCSEVDDYNQALSYFEKGLEVAIKQAKDQDILAGYYNKASALKSLDRNNEAISNLKEGVRLSQEADDLKSLRSCYGLLAECYESAGETNKAFEYFDLFKSIDRKIKNQEKTELVESSNEKVKEIQQEKVKTELELNRTYSELEETKDSLKRSEANITRKQSEIEAQEEALAQKEALLKSERQRRIILTSGILLVVFFLILTIVQSRQKKSVIDKLEEKNVQINNQKKEIEEQRDFVTQQKLAITDSIEYARRIQNALLPPEYYIKNYLSDYFIFYRPRDIVSGDFYWMMNKDNKIILAVADCTGHGVPGAFMSMLGISHLNEIVNKIVDNKHFHALQANEILNQLRTYVSDSLHQRGKWDDAKDGIDIALCIIDQENKTLQYSGAHNPMLLFRDNKQKIIKGDRMSVSYSNGVRKYFTNHEISIQEGDMIYLFTDGYADQLGGPRNRKFMSRYFYEMLGDIHQLPLPDQQEILETKYKEWKGDYRQIDDILVMGIKIHEYTRKPKKASDYDWQDKKILIADDTEANYIFLVQALKNTGAQIVRARNGLEAVEQVKNDESIDLVLMDVSMPKMDGFEATLKIREFSDIPIIAQTALNMKEAKKRSIEAKCNDFILKPIKFKTFLTILEKYLK